MDNFIYEYKTKVIFGNGSAKNNLANELEKYGKNIYKSKWYLSRSY